MRERSDELKHKKTVNFGYRYSIVLGESERFSAGRRVSEVERIRQIQQRQVWLQDCRNLGYDPNEAPLDAMAEPVPTGRQRAKSNYSAEVLAQSNCAEDLPDPFAPMAPGLEKLEDFLCETSIDRQVVQEACRLRATTSYTFEGGETEAPPVRRRRAYTADVLDPPPRTDALTNGA